MPIESKADALIALREANDENEQLRAERDELVEALSDVVEARWMISPAFRTDSGGYRDRLDKAAAVLRRVRGEASDG